MTDLLPERDDDRFEEVLGRLDALVRRGQPSIEPPPPPLIESASIPVLTEVYQPEQDERLAEIPTLTEALASKPAVSVEEKLEQMLLEVLPEMAGILEEALVQRLKPAMEDALARALADLRPQTEELLRQRLRQVLVQEESQKDI
jgi:hypothetical protein